MLMGNEVIIKHAFLVCLPKKKGAREEAKPMSDRRLMVSVDRHALLALLGSC